MDVEVDADIDVDIWVAVFTNLNQVSILWIYSSNLSSLTASQARECLRFSLPFFLLHVPLPKALQLPCGYIWGLLQGAWEWKHLVQV